MAMTAALTTESQPVGCATHPCIAVSRYDTYGGKYRIRTVQNTVLQQISKNDTLIRITFYYWRVNNTDITTGWPSG